MHAGSTVIELDPTGQHGANNQTANRPCTSLLVGGMQEASIFTSMFRVPNLWVGPSLTPMRARASCTSILLIKGHSLRSVSS